MKINILGLMVVFAATLAYSVDRPKITGIDHADFYTTSAEANSQLYTVVLGLTSAKPVEVRQTQRFVVGKQFVGYSPAPDAHATNRLDHVAFATDSCSRLQRYLTAHGVKIQKARGEFKDGTRSFLVEDPEGNTIEFVQRSASAKIPVGSAEAISRHMIHVGFIVHSRDDEDHFYKDILGFHVYWHGGMKAERNDWVAMQVPDGTDWLEYMLNVKADADQHTIGVMNHISLGVKDMKQAQAKLESHGWTAHGEEHAQMGRDGKWQLNLYDPDFTRIELMEFKPAEKPCCSEFTGKHPTE
jgi:catechol 2,3-dioxygenase-like lactoylglutathione lyase family enzyme